MRIVHICFSIGAEVNIKSALSKGKIEGDNVIAFYDDLSMGSVRNDDIISIRQKWWDKVYGESNNRYLIPSIEKNYTKFIDYINELENVNICLWFGRNSQEACGMLYLIDLIKGKNYNIEFVNVSNIDKLSNRYSNVGEVPSGELEICYENKKIMKDEVIFRLSNQWKELVVYSSSLRVVKDNTIISVNENYYDDIILSKTDNTLKEASRVVALVMTCIKPSICDRFILWRIREMIFDKKIKSYGNPYNMMELYIQR